MKRKSKVVRLRHMKKYCSGPNYSDFAPTSARIVHSIFYGLLQVHFQHLFHYQQVSLSLFFLSFSCCSYLNSPRKLNTCDTLLQRERKAEFSSFNLPSWAPSNMTTAHNASSSSTSSLPPSRGQCRICLSEDDSKEALISPCSCKGSM